MESEKRKTGLVYPRVGDEENALLPHGLTRWDTRPQTERCGVRSGNDTYLMEAKMDTGTRKKGQHGVPKGYINMAELCRLFGRSRKTIHIMVETGALPRPLKFGRQNIWEQKEIQRWLDNAKFCK